MLSSLDSLLEEDDFLPRDLEFQVIFRPHDEVVEAHRNLGSIDMAEDAIAEIEPLLREIENSFNLNPGLFRVEPRAPGLAIYAYSRKSFDLKIEISLDEATSRLLNYGKSGQSHVIDLSNVAASSDGKITPLVLGPVLKLAKNALEPLLPLLLRVDSAPYESFLSDVGPVHVIGFLDKDGGVYGTPFHMESYQGTIEIFFHRRDLSRLDFQENYIFFAHFALVD